MTSPFGCKDEYFVGKEIDLDGVDELVWVSDVALPLEQLPQPGELGVVWIIAFMPLLVLPMGSDPELRVLRCISAVRICISIRSP